MNDIAFQSLLRPEKSADFSAIYALTKAAFAPMPFAAGNEQDLINTLRDEGALSLSLVAEYQEQVIAHIAFSIATTKDESTHWYGLGPVSVAPHLQRQGIGSKLILHGLALLRQRNADGCILVGNAEYYKRFGFQLAPQLCPNGEPKDHYMILPMSQNIPTSAIHFHPLFYDKEQ